MMERQVTYVVKTHGRVTGIGGDGWELDEAEAIRRIKQSQEAFYTYEDGHKAYVDVYRYNGVDNLRTHRDGTWNNNLSALRSCRTE